LAALLQDHAGAKVDLVPGARGAFEVFVNGTLMFSKLATGRFPESEEVLEMLSP